MKKIVFLTILLCLVSSSIVLAGQAIAPQEEKDIRQISSDIRDLGYIFDSGVTYKQFNEKYSDVYIKYRKFRDTYPLSKFTYNLSKTILPYSDGKELWLNKVQLNWSTVPRDTADTLKSKYPGIENQVKIFKLFNSWEIDSTILALSNFAQQYRQDLDKQINNESTISSESK